MACPGKWTQRQKPAFFGGIILTHNQMEGASKRWENPSPPPPVAPECPGKKGNPKMGCPGKWKRLNENLQFAGGLILTHTQMEGASKHGPKMAHRARQAWRVLVQTCMPPPDGPIYEGDPKVGVVSFFALIFTRTPSQLKKLN